MLDVAHLSELKNKHLAYLLYWRAQHAPDKPAYLFLQKDDFEQVITYRELNEKAIAVGLQIQKVANSGDRVLIMCPPGLDYIVSFFGCLYADTIAVPAYPVHPSRLARTLPRLQAIVTNAQAHIALITFDAQQNMTSLGSASTMFEHISWIVVDKLETNSNEIALPPPKEELAFLMYTSGSTGEPKGVMVSHLNALHNARTFPGFGKRPFKTVVSWLPFFHDLGLFLGIIHPLYQEVLSVLMSPTDFVRRPVNWLEAMSRFRATTTGGPNFAYDLCIRKTTPEQRAALDLSQWNLALNGAEPIRSHTIKEFTHTFESAGFRPETFYPSYGLADATATVTGPTALVRPKTISLDRSALKNKKIVQALLADDKNITLVGCGQTISDQTIMIVNPETLTPCDEKSVGEIWVSGPSIGRGYWNRPEETKCVFGAELEQTPGQSYLRTGDLGFLVDRELYVVGRLKDLIIIRGQNYHPEDIELTMEKAHEHLRAGCGAAFSIDAANEEQLVLVQEVENVPAEHYHEIISAIRHAITTRHGISPYQINLIKTNNIPKTSSGKIQRNACRQQLFDQMLPIVKTWQAESVSSVRTGTSNVTDIKHWLLTWLSHSLDIPVKDIDTDKPLSDLNLDSLKAISMVGELEEALDQPLSATLIWNYPTIDALVNYLASMSRSPIAKTNRLAEKYIDEPIAIIGMDCNFPGAFNLGEFWRLLHDGIDAITEVPANRWDSDLFYDLNQLVPGKMTTKWGGFLSDAEMFDASLFGISPREACKMDPQQRKILEVTWRALEHACEPPSSIAGSNTGVFLGICNSDHSRLALSQHSHIDLYGGTGTAYSIVANRLSYIFNFQGPSISVDTACSSSLVALHLACQSLRQGECERAVVGGVNLILSPEISIAFSKATMMAADGRCKTFDARADGYVRSEGVGVVILKPLSQALANKDKILALIRGTAVNQDGRSNGITAPNGLAQEAVITKALQQANISPEHLSYIEAHGTGTPIGDAIEIASWNSVLGSQSTRTPIGSVKTNIGHTEAAAGIAGLIKVVLAMQHNLIPAQLYGHNINPQLNIEETALEIATKPRPWPQTVLAHFASISSFGFGGTNANVILERVSAENAPPTNKNDRSHYLFALSGNSPKSLHTQVLQLQEMLQSSTDCLLPDIAYTINISRAQLYHRLAFVVETKKQAQAIIAGWLENNEQADIWQHDAHMRDEPVVFVFPGQGSHYVNMGREIYQTNKLFQATIDECARILNEDYEIDLIACLNLDSQSDSVAIDHWRLQPALFSIEYALARLWMSWDIKPTAVLGHSMGEYAAACIAGIISLRDALKLVVTRAQLVESLPKDGAMVAVMTTAEIVHSYLAAFPDQIFVASYNNPQLVIITGAKSALQNLLPRLTEDEISYRELPIANAFHSAAMMPIHDAFLQVAQTIEHHPPRILFVANITGSIATPNQINPAYWAEHLLQPVQFQQSIECLLNQEYKIFLEIGPKPTLTNTIRRIAPNKRDLLILSSLSGHVDQPDWWMMLRCLGKLFTRGVTLNGRALDALYTRTAVNLPPYPFEQQYYPIGYAEHCQSQKTQNAHRIHPLIDRALMTPLIKDGIFERELHVVNDSFLQDHRIQDVPTLAGAVQIELMLAAAHQHNKDRQPTGIKNLIFSTPLHLRKSALLQVIIPADEAGTEAIITIFSKTNDQPWQKHAVGEITCVLTNPQHVDLSLLQVKCSQNIPVAAIYSAFKNSGIQYGPSFRTLENVWLGENDVLAELAARREGQNSKYRLVPELLDGSLQALSVLFKKQNQSATFVPFVIEEITLFTEMPTPNRLYCYGQRIKPVQSSGQVANLTLVSADGAVFAQLKGIHFRELVDKPEENQPQVRNWLQTPIWKLSELPVLQTLETQTILLFADVYGIGMALHARLQAQGHTVFVVQSGNEFQQTDQSFLIRPDNAEDYGLLAAAVKGQSIDSIIHLWSCDNKPGFVNSLADIDTQLTSGSQSLLYLMQTFARLQQPKRVFIVSAYAQATEGGVANRPITPLNAAVVGLSKVISLEYPQTAVSGIDIEPAAHSTNDIVTQILAELQTKCSESGKWVSYHHNQRFEITLNPIPNSAGTNTAMPVRRKGVYLITGGQGGIGLEFAKWITRQETAVLILVNRTPLDKNPSSKRVQAVQELEKAGATVKCVAADVSDLTAMQILIEVVWGEYGRIDGVFHAAGVLDDALLWNMTWQRFTRAIQPKVHGTWVLAHLLQAVPLDFFVICSSMASLDPSLGQANHVAANAVEDSFAHLLKQMGLPIITINWGLWGETGVVAKPGYIKTLEARGIYAFTNEEGLTGLVHSWQSGHTQVSFTKPKPNDFLEPDHVSSLHTFINELTKQKNLESMADATKKIEHICVQYIVQALIELGLNPLLHNQFTAPQIMTQFQITLQHRHLFEHLLNFLVAQDVLRQQDDTYYLHKLPNLEDLDLINEQLATAYSGLQNELTLLQRCGIDLASALTGKVNALTLLFPNGIHSSSGKMYESSTFAQVYNTVVAKIISDFCNELQKDTQISLLEVGAGTGGTTTYVLEALSHLQNVDYTFSDISPSFLSAAQNKYSEYKNIDYKLVDLERDFTSQNIHPQQYHIILAANVIHATSNPAAIIEKLKQLLAPGGILVFLELIKPQPWLDLTFGLTTGWWKSTEAAMRHYPLLSVSEWEALLAQANFAQTTIIKPSLNRPLPVEQAIIICQVKHTAHPHMSTKQPTQSIVSTANTKAIKTLVQSMNAEDTPMSKVQKTVAEQVQRVLQLGTATIPPGRSFHDLGLDSLLAIEITKGIRQQLEIDINPIVFFEYPTLSELCQHIYQANGKAIDALFSIDSTSSPETVSTPSVNTPPYPKITHNGSGEPDTYQDTDIAIIGMACRFPKAPDLESYWELLQSGGEAIVEIPETRWDWASYFDEEPGKAGKTYSRWGGYIEDVDLFDARFFNVSPKEATLMDPQQRLLLETTWHALENAGYAGEAVADTATGVFVGCSYNHYLQLLNRELPSDSSNYFAALGNNHSILANRISFFLNLNGPSIVVDTLCSSSLTALHMACRSIHNNESTMAIVGGVNLLLNVDHYLSMSHMRSYAPDGRCKTFDHRADGFVSGEGLGVILIKPLAQALQDGDHVQAVIKGTAVNHNGRSNGLTAPNAAHQADVIRQAHQSAKWDLQTVSLIEAHGTGTALGDPIEVEGLSQVFTPRDDSTPPCYLGAVKTNIGHLESAAGIAGLMKVVLAMKHGVIPPTLNFEKINPFINLKETPFRINTDGIPWNFVKKRRAGISAFGLGGVNAHIAIEASPETKPPTTLTPGLFLFPLSATNEKSLNILITDHCNFLQNGLEDRFIDCCYTASIGRGHFTHRLAILTTGPTDLLHKLDTFLHAQNKQNSQNKHIFYNVAYPDDLADPTRHEPQDYLVDTEATLIDVAQAYILGKRINWQHLYAPFSVKKTNLPIYPFTQTRFWFQKNERDQ